MTVKEMRPAWFRLAVAIQGEGLMPIIAIVDGVQIRMFHNDHAPPHFHAILGGDEVLITIRSLDVIRGSLPPAKQRRIMEWARGHQGELALNWIKCQDDQPPERIG